jgi:hypothetical protein
VTTGDATELVSFVLFVYSWIASSEELAATVGGQDSEVVFVNETLSFWRAPVFTPKLAALVLAAKLCDGDEVLRLLLGGWSS